MVRSSDKYSRAVSSSQLRLQDDPGTQNDADVLIAAGLIRESLASSLYRLRAEFDRADRRELASEERAPLELSSIRSLQGTKRSLDRFVLQMSNNMGLDLSAKSALAISAAILQHFLDPTCRECKGVKYKPIPGTGRLSNTPCPSCNGSGSTRVQIPNGYGADGIRLAATVQEEISTKMEHFDRMLARWLSSR